MKDNNKENIREYIRKNYAEVAKNNGSTSCGCCGTQEEVNTISIDQVSEKIGYKSDDLKEIPQEAIMGLGCGNPLVIASLNQGETVLDLGSGGGIDCFLARKKVGNTGYVIGIDMTPDMIKLSRNLAEKEGYSNIEFRLGEIEHLPVSNDSIDVIISNCVINLSLEKEKVFQEAYRVLKPGGRLSISDIMATSEIDDDIRNDLAMIAGCIAGAERVDNVIEMLENTGFKNIKTEIQENSGQIIKSWAPNKKLDSFIASFILTAEK